MSNSVSRADLLKVRVVLEPIQAAGGRSDTILLPSAGKVTKERNFVSLITSILFLS